MGLSMKIIEIIVEAENAQSVLEALECKNIKHRSIKDLEAIERLEANKSRGEGCRGGEKKSPNILQKGINLALASAEHLITGIKHVTPSVYLQRLEKCKGCDYRQEGFVCSRCGCYMGIKASWAEQKCKENKW
jgi:hypothetical protein